MSLRKIQSDFDSNEEVRSSVSCKFLSKCDIYAVSDRFLQEITGHRRSPLPY
ncbi:hypothetical protein [Nostoc commune]|uniref:hypothetical protein n=1 Tax=Nostoc commune TaxID=1178 RepID=UPI0018C6931F|nr:hypothetical protein [Nostoc commune]